MKAFLKIKIKSLAAEAVIIRQEERKYPRKGYNIRWHLKEHRKHDVRDEARDAQLAYGFLRGRMYSTMEAKCHLPPTWSNIMRMITKYGTDDLPKWCLSAEELKPRFEIWKAGGDQKAELPVKTLVTTMKEAVKKAVGL
jgi:hypothetical protein